jgi:phospholipase C
VAAQGQEQGMSTPDIEHVVVLMLENRSFDSMLGWLYQTGAPSQFLPAGTTPTYFGLQSINLGDFTNTAQNPALSSPPIQGAQGFTVPTADPGEDFAQVNQQLFNTTTYPPTGPANMLGYLQDYVDVLQALGMDSGDIPAQAPQVMQTYTASQLPVLNQLAQAYAVSDAWYASAPSQTNPNRAFLMSGTSMGLVNNGQLETSSQAQELDKLLGMAIGDDRFDTPTIFNALSSGGVDWAVFWQTSYLPEKISTLLEYGAALAAILTIYDPPIGIALDSALAALSPYISYIDGLTNGELESCYTWRLFPQLQGLPNAANNFQSLDQFFSLAEAGNLPAFSYIEPYWSISQVTTPTLSQLPKALLTALGNDYHPPSNLLVGEAFVKAVYTSLIANQAAWEKTLLLITFDEFVGSFDHQTDGLQQGLVQPPWGTGTPPALATQNNFNFDRLGARVPTIVVSPWVQAGTVFRSPTATPYDHTSMIATSLKLLGLSAQTSTFGARTAAAPTFETVLTLDTPRTDAASLPFVDKTHYTGDPVNYGDSFLLQNVNGDYLTVFSAEVKSTIPGLPSGAMGICVDLGLAANFPTLGSGAPAPVSFLSPASNVSGQVPDQAQVLLISRETGLGAADALGAWSDSHDCYYFAPYFTAPYAANQTWTIQNQTEAGQPLCYGTKVTLMNQSFWQGLSRDTRWFEGGWISTSASPDSWTIQPAPVTPPS